MQDEGRSFSSRVRGLGCLLASAVVLLLGCAAPPPAIEPRVSPAETAGVGAAPPTPSGSIAASASPAAPTGGSSAEGSIGPSKPESTAASAPPEPKPQAPVDPFEVSEADPSWGNRQAPITIVQFADLQCPFSARVQSTLLEVQALYGPEWVRLVWKNNPLPFHKQAPYTHEVAMLVHRKRGDAAFWKFAARAFENYGSLTDENIARWAQESGLTQRELKAAFPNEQSAKKVQSDIDLARKVGATGTPGFRINGVTLSGAQPLDRFKAVLDEQVIKARELQGSGMPREKISAFLTAANYREPPPSEPSPAAKPADLTQWKVPVLPTDPQRGSAEALVTIVQFASFQCPFCNRVNATLEQLFSRYGNDIRLVWKDNALPFHKESRPAATLARHAFALKGNAGFWKAHAALFAKQRDLGETTYQAISQELGLGWPSTQQAITSGKYDALINASMITAEDFGARGIPYFFINGRRLAGAQPLEHFTTLIDEQLKAARDLVAQGTPRAQIYDKVLENASAPPQPETRVAPKVSKENPSRGPANARVVVQLFSDFACPHSARARRTLADLQQRYPKDVRIVFRHFPLPFHSQAPAAAEAAIEVFEQKGNAAFWKFHDLLFSDQKALALEDLRTYATELGVNLKRFDDAMSSGRHRARVEADMAAAAALSIKGTPAFLLNDYFLSGAQPIEAFVKRVELAKGNQHEASSAFKPE